MPGKHHLSRSCESLIAYSRKPTTNVGNTGHHPTRAMNHSLNQDVLSTSRPILNIARPATLSRRRRIWCQRRDSNSQTPVSKTGRYSNSRTLATWCTGEDLNLRVPLGETGLQPVRFVRAHAAVQSWRKVDESNAHRSSRCPGFQDQLPAIQQYLPQWRRVRELNPLASCESPCLADKCLTVRPTLR